MPVNPIQMKDSLDRFYTKDSVAKECIDTTISLFGTEHLFIEPSAGGGAFYRQLPKNKIGIDLSPASDGVIKGDWFDFDVPENSIVIGNPPFGTRNQLTKAFIKHAIKKAAVVAFILPSSYRKETTQKIFPSDWALCHSESLPENSFLFEGEDYHVPCVFQVWVKKGFYEGLTDLRESSKVKIVTEDFKFCGKEDADFFVFGASPSKIVEKELVNSNNRGYYVKQEKPGVIEKFKKIDWKLHANSSVSGGVAWYSKQEIINIYEEHKDDS